MALFPNNHSEFKFDLTDSAFKQIKLIQDNDFTLEGLSFRLKIGGKGCDGFTYDTGFSEKHKDDITLNFINDGVELEILSDDFTAFYCKEGNLDYFFIPHENEGGFFFTNINEFKHHGKFFKDGDYVPPIKENSETEA